MQRTLLLLLSWIVLCTFARHTLAQEHTGPWGVTVAVGEGAAGQRHDTYRLSLQRHWNRRFWETKQFHFTGLWDVGVTLWDASDVERGPLDNGATRLWVIGASPVLRWQFRTFGAARLAPFLELGVGLSLLSDRELRSGNNRALRLGTQWQFEDRFSLGLRFGEEGRWELAYQIMHHSNLDADEENAGVDSQLLSIKRRF